MNSLIQRNIKTIVAISILAITGIFLGFNLKNIAHKPTDTRVEKSIKSTGKTVLNEENEVQELKIYDTWTHYTKADGLPSNKINCVRVDGDRLWIGTDKGLAVMENEKIVHVYNEEDGLAHHNVVSVDVSPTTGDIWIGTMGGLNHLSAGRFETFNEDLSSVIETIGTTHFAINRKNVSVPRFDYKDYYDEPLKEKVARIYHKDINIFNYDF